VQKQAYIAKGKKQYTQRSCRKARKPAVKQRKRGGNFGRGGRQGMLKSQGGVGHSNGVSIRKQKRMEQGRGTTAEGFPL